MYNGVGVQTARGTGTSGYVQANLSALNYSRHKKVYNTEDDIAKAEAEVNRRPNQELLDHEYKRRIEIKCIELQDLMEAEGSAQEEIDTKVNEYRKLLFDEFEAGKINLDDELDIKNSHSRAKVAKDNRDRFRKAFKIRDDFVEGTSMANMKKITEPDLEVKQEEKDDEMELKRKLLEQIREEKKARKQKKEQKKEEKKRLKELKKKVKKRKRDASSSSDDSSDHKKKKSRRREDSSSEDSSDSESRKKSKKSHKRR